AAEGSARTQVAAARDQARALQRGGHADHVGQQLGQRHGAAHGVAPLRLAGRTGATTGAAEAVAVPVALARLASSADCAASQVWMSSGGTSISRRAPSITRANSGAEIQPPP